MAKDTKKSRKKDHHISSIASTNDCMTNRAGLTFFAAYLQSIQLIPIMKTMFGTIRKNKKGVPVDDLFFQLLCFFMDGTCRHLTRFDSLKDEKSYAPLIGCEPQHLASSHAVKRFFRAFAFRGVHPFRHLLQKIFLWRLNIEKPAVIELGIDSMVLNNNDALKREGVEPTYKKVNGFHPVQMNWGRYFVDAIFQVGSDHSNHEANVHLMLCNIVKTIRKEYRLDVPIIVRMDSGFYDQKLFATCDALHIGYICGGKRYENVKKAAEESGNWSKFKSFNEKELWEYTDFLCQQDTWDFARRTIYSRLIQQDRQLVAHGLGTDSVLITNLGMGGLIDELLWRAKAENLLVAHDILGNYHQRGNDELANRAIKNFGEEQLPFKDFNANAAWYFLMMLGNNVFESFKIDVSASVIPVTVYADTFRRKFIDTAAKIVRNGKKLIMKVPTACLQRLQFDKLFDRCLNVTVMRC
jgi:hypothetical protein